MSSTPPPAEPRSASKNPDTRFRTRRASGEFAEAAMERRYRTDVLQTNRYTYWKIALCITFVLPTFSFIDLSSLGLGSEFVVLAGARIASSLVVLLAGLKLRRDPVAFVGRTGRIWLSIGQLAVFGSAMLACALRPQDATTNALSVVVLALAALVMVPGRFWDQIVLATGVLTAFVGISMWRYDDPALPMVPLLTNLAVALCWGAIILSFSNRGHRRLWAMAQREQSTNERLNSELVVADQLRSELQQLARQDPLTGAANRREFIQVAGERLPDESGTDRLAMLVMDVDRFKSVNDHFGHAVGDAALVKLVAAARSVLRDDDLIARIGGEEFAVLLPGLDGPAAANAAERVRTAIRQAPLPEGPTEPITVSVGVAVAVPGGTVAELMARADEAMYRAKRDGGDSVSTDADDDAAVRLVEGPWPHQHVS